MTDEELTPERLYAPFRPRRGRVVPLVMAALSVVVFAVVAWRIPGDGAQHWTAADKVMVALVGIAIAAALSRWAGVRAVPSEKGIEIRNLLGRRTVAWPQVVDVQFGNGLPWARLELNDFDTVSVMAVQRSDGPFAEREAQRLATLVEMGSRTDVDH